MKAPILRVSNQAAAVVGIVVGAFIFGVIYLVRPPSAPVTPPIRPTAVAQPAPTVPGDGTAAAKAKVCTTFHQADDVIGVAMNTPGGAADPATANAKVGAAVASSALALTRAIDSVTPPDIARPATDLVDAYSTYAQSAYVNGKPDPSAVVAATAAMRQACG